jgi:hypothetical protein
MSYYEIMLLLGTVSGVTAAARIFTAMVDGRVPRFSFVLLFAAIGMFFYASTLAPAEGMSWRDIPGAVMSLIGELK